MHLSAMEHGRLFFECYLKGREGITVVDVGSQDVSGSLRSVAPKGCRYIGLDFVDGPGVDVVMDAPYRLPIDDGMVDAVVCSSCLEHSEFFWLLFLEMLRITKPNGLIYLNVPSNGSFHRYPVDCWRFYPDSGAALARWGQHNGYRTPRKTRCAAAC
jgi:SAM-dependent methyltransferase